VVGESVQVFSKVSLGDIFYVKSNDASKHRIYTNKIDRKHVDFLLCNPKAVRPFLGIELDDKSHQRNDRQERDQFVDQVFAAAGIPLVRVPVKHTYSLQEVQALLQPDPAGCQSTATAG
jgi:very-short-patch-repair endonuclease